MLFIKLILSMYTSYYLHSFLLFLLFFSLTACAQKSVPQKKETTQENSSAKATIFQPKRMLASEDYDNIKVEKLHSDSLGSTFVIWVKKGVKAHRHLEHTEQVYILEGSGQMVIEQDTTYIHPGDWIVIPKGVVHAVTEVYGSRPLKVISIQTPEFLGKDRVFVEEKDLNKSAK